MNINISSLIRRFVIGSTVSIAPLIYLGIAYNKLTCEEQSGMKIKYANMAMALPVFYGITYVILHKLFENVDSRYRYFLIGAVAGLLYSLIGHFVFRVPETLLKSKYPNSVHITAPIIYSLIYGILVSQLEKHISCKE